jgi:hypothetical protein
MLTGPLPCLLSFSQKVGVNMKRRVLLEDDDSPVLASLADDRLEGAGEIAEYWFGSDTPQHRKAIFHYCAKRLLPIGKLGAKLIASRKALEEHQRKATRL